MINKKIDEISDKLDTINALVQDNEYLENVLGQESISPTITTRIALSDGGGINASTKLYCEELNDNKNLRNDFKNKKIRYYTELDCWRLMGFEQKDYNNAKEKLQTLNITNNQVKGCLYKQAGNSIVVNVLEEILKKLLKEEKNDK